MPLVVCCSWRWKLRLGAVRSPADYGCFIAKTPAADIQRRRREGRGYHWITAGKQIRSKGPLNGVVPDSDRAIQGAVIADRPHPVCPADAICHNALSGPRYLVVMDGASKDVYSRFGVLANIGPAQTAWAWSIGWPQQIPGMPAEHDPEITIPIAVDDVPGDVGPEKVSISKVIPVVVIEHDHAQAAGCIARIVMEMVAQDP